METTEVTTLMNKNVNDLTVGDAIKINIGIMAVMAAIPAALYGVGYAKDQVATWSMNRKNKKFQEELLES